MKLWLASFNVEPFQIVAYKNGQDLKHHDMGELMGWYSPSW